MSKRHRYLVTLSTPPGITDDESHRCLRAFLKAAIRQWDIQCTSAEPIDPASEPTAQDAPQRTIGGQDDE
jgi:hypothetical protein